MNETYKSLVDWYYIEEWSDYPGPKGRVVPDAEGYDNPGDYEGVELYISQGTIGDKEGNLFIDEEGNDVPFDMQYFEKTNSLNENKMTNEQLRMQMLSGIITEGEYKAKLEENFFSNLLNKLKGSNPPEEIKKDYFDSLTDEEAKKVRAQAVSMYDELWKAREEGMPDDGQISSYGDFISKIDAKFPNLKKSLNENFVGMGMVGNIFDREKTDYEIAFEHFSKNTSLNEEYYEDEMPEAPSHEETDANQVYEMEIEEAEVNITPDFLKGFKLAVGKIMADSKFKDAEEALGLTVDANGRNMGEVFQKIWDKAIKS